MKATSILFVVILMTIGFAATSVPAQEPTTTEGYTFRGFGKMSGDPYGAIADFTKALELDPKNGSALQHRAMVKERLKDYQGALSDYTKLIEILPWTGYSYRAALKRDMGDKEGADADDAKARQYERLNLDNDIEANPNDAHKLKDRASRRKREGDYDGSIADYTRAIALAPDSNSYGGRAESRVFKGDYDGALDDYTKAISIYSTEAWHNYRGAEDFLAWLHDGRAAAKLKKNDYGGAMKDFDKAVEVAPKYNDAYYNRCEAKHDHSEYDGAIADCSRAIELPPANIAAFAVRGSAKSYKGDYDAALIDLDEAIRLSPKYTWALNRRAWTRYLKKDYDGAIADYTTVIDLNPKNDAAFANRAGAKRNKKDLYGAVVDDTRAIELAPTRPSYYFARASTKRELGDDAGAKADYAKAAELEPTKADNWFKVAFYIAFLDGRFEESLPYYNRAIELDPKNSNQWWERGLVYLGLSRRLEALSDFRKDLELADSQGARDTAQMCIWIARATNREHLAATLDLAAYAKQQSRPASADDLWRWLSARYLADNITEAEFFKEATALKPEEKDRIYTFFFAGWKHLAKGDRVGAASYFEKCTKLSSPQGWFYYNSLYELKRLRGRA